MRASAALVVAALMALSGCVTPEERARNLAAHEAEERAAQQAYVRQLNAKCSSYGFRQGTDAFADCFRKEHNETQRCARLRREMQQRFFQNMTRSDFLESVSRMPSPAEYGC